MTVDFIETVKGIELIRNFTKARLVVLNELIDRWCSEEKYIEAIVKLCNGEKRAAPIRLVKAAFEMEMRSHKLLLDKLDENERKLNSLVYFCNYGKFPDEQEKFFVWQIKIIIK